MASRRPLPWCYGSWTPCLKSRDCIHETGCYHAEDDRARMDGEHHGEVRV